jgi:hypothetical protein
MEPVEMELDGARAMVAGAVEKWIGFMRAHGLTICPFVCAHQGALDNDQTALTVALHAEALERRGYEVVSHALALEPGLTRVSLLVRAPKVVS